MPIATVALQRKGKTEPSPTILSDSIGKNTKIECGGDEIHAESGVFYGKTTNKWRISELKMQAQALFLSNGKMFFRDRPSNSDQISSFKAKIKKKGGIPPTSIPP